MNRYLPRSFSKWTVDRVPGGARHIGDDDPLLPQDAVDQGGLAHIGLADDGHLDDIVLLVLLRPRGGSARSRRPAGRRCRGRGRRRRRWGRPGPGYRTRRCPGSPGPTWSALLHRQHHRLPGPEEHVGHLLVGCGHAGRDVDRQRPSPSAVSMAISACSAHEGEDLARPSPARSRRCPRASNTPAPPLALGVHAGPG